MAWLLATKLEMTRVIKWNDFIPVTLLKVPALKVLAVKTTETDGYEAIVIGILESDAEWSLKEGNKALNVKEFSDVKEIRLSVDEIGKYQVWQDLGLDDLEGVELVEVTWISKGKWFAGAMKRHNFSGGPWTHGSKFHRALGSIGNRKPRRTHKGKKMHGHMWCDQITIKKISLELVNKSLQVIGVRGPVPGGRNSLVIVKF